MDASDTILEVRDLAAAYGGDTVLENVSFNVRRGEIFIVLGGSGCGKSTLLKNLIGLYPLVAGEVLIDGRDLAASSGEDRRRILHRVGVMYQSGALFGSMTLLENVRLPLEITSDLPREAMDLISAMRLKQVGLADYASHLPSEISGGMVKRAAIARAMSLDPPILFLDEPTAGLDPVTSADMDALIKELNASRGMTFVIVTHELPSIYAIADRVIMLDRKTKGIIAEGRPADLRDQSTIPEVQKFFRREVSTP